MKRVYVCMAKGLHAVATKPILNGVVGRVSVSLFAGQKVCSN